MDRRTAQLASPVVKPTTPDSGSPAVLVRLVSMRPSSPMFQTRYNERRPHWALIPEAGGDPFVPTEVYADHHAIQIPRWQTWARAAQNKLEELMQSAA